MSLVAPHIPAWKKIGLKLKYAKEEAEDPHSQLATVPPAKGVFHLINKRKLPSLDSSPFTPPALEPLPKKARKIERTGNLLLGGVTELNGIHSKYQSESIPFGGDDVTFGAPRGKRKSVSFTPETKTEDGSSWKEAYKDWVKEQQVRNPDFDSEKLNPALKLDDNGEGKENVNSASLAVKQSNELPAQPSPITSPREGKGSLPPTIQAQPKKPKKKKKIKSMPNAQTQSQPPHSTQPSLSHLTYLTAHYSSPSEWKFSKPLQNHLLKQLFSTSQIPSTYDPALLSYLSGLKGASARQRIRAQALEIRKEDEEWLSSSTSPIPRLPDSEPSKPSAPYHENKSSGANPPEQTEEEEGMNTTSTLESDEGRHARNKAAYKAEVARFKALLRKKADEKEERDWEVYGKREWEVRWLKRRRAELVLWAVGEAEEPAATMAAGPALKKMKMEDANGDGGGGGGGSGVNGDVGVEKGVGWIYGRDAGKINGIWKGPMPKKIIFKDNDGDDDDDDNGATRAGMVNGNNEARAMVGSNNPLPPPTGRQDQARKPKRKRRGKKRTGLPDDDDDDETSSSSSSSDSGEEEKRRDHAIARVLANVVGKEKVRQGSRW